MIDTLGEQDFLKGLDGFEYLRYRERVQIILEDVEIFPWKMRATLYAGFRTAGNAKRVAKVIGYVEK